MVNLALIGMGLVGSQVLKIIEKNLQKYKDQYNIDFNFTAIFEYDGALISDAGISVSEVLGSHNFRDLDYWKPGVQAIEAIPDTKADIIIDATPVNPDTGEPALSHILKALKSKKHVVTSNKGPFYLAYENIKEIAEKNGVSFGFESTVGSAVPCLGIRDSLAGNKIKKIVGVLNGTSNYILNRMTSEGISFNLALQEAQENGYAETDPTLDIEGYDAAGKLVILANHLLGWNKTIKDVKISGITKVNEDMISLAKKSHMEIKHLAVAKDGELEVSLKLIPENSALALGGTLNGVYLDTELAGEIIITGRGAGGSEAAAGIISDVINISRRYLLADT
ncbi:MAG: homoserine dehydrogenase [Candidatus Lokiarchaeota archaeon]|nr:homoserine dehydrogenase [Candidatus Lokiarchaeota archaeon]